MKRSICLLTLLVFACTALASDDWVQRSNASARVLLGVMAEFTPEQAARLGVDGVDGDILDLSENHLERHQAALIGALAELRKQHADSRHPDHRLDLELMMRHAEHSLRGMKLQHQYILPWYNLPEIIFRSVQALLDPRTDAARRPAVVTRLQRYAGLESGYSALTELARTRTSERLGEDGLLGPYRPQLDMDLANAARFMAGTRGLLEASGVDGWEDAMDTLDTQVHDYLAWARADLRTVARDDSRLPEALYRHRLESAGVDIPVEALIAQARTAFGALQLEMQALAGLIAERHGWSERDYRAVLGRLKARQLDAEEILPLYNQRLAVIETLIREHELVTLPARAAVIRLGDEAESAANPAPHMSPPRMLGNTGEYGEFVLPMNVPSADGRELAYDDFTYDAATWPLTAHEARPGHELQYSAVIEQGVSIPRVVFARNSVNIEGWALYAEAFMAPYLPPEGQLVTLQFRLLRAARAFLDPMINRGEIGIEQARHLLREDVVLSEAMAEQEVNRYSFRAPGQAPSYFYGYQRLLDLRAHTQLQLGDNFNTRAFHDFILAQGFLPPDLMARAVENAFVGELDRAPAEAADQRDSQVMNTMIDPASK